MTLRALILGLLGAAFIAGVGYLNDQVLKLTPFVGNYFPISVFGLLFVFVLGVNPLLYLVRKSWRLASNELAVILAMMLVVCSIPGSGLMRTFTPVLVMPTRYAQDDHGWKKNRPREDALSVVNYVPSVMLPAEGKNDPAVIEAARTGLKHNNRNIGVDEIPWEGWAQPLQTWLPIIFLLGVSVISLSVIVHRQWGHRERLRYPIAEVAESLVAQEPDRAVGPIFRNKKFWIGLTVVMLIHLINGYYQWSGNKTIQIPLKLTMEAVAQKYPRLNQASGQGHFLLTPEFFPTVVAFGFFLATDVGLSLGLSQVFYIALWMALNTAGTNISRNWMTGGVPDYQRFGSYLGVGLILFYMGRRYYWETLRKALCPWLKHEAERAAVWACRAFILATVAVIAILAGVGLDWPIALLLVGLILLLYLVMARINAESGLFFIQAWWVPVAVLYGLFGMNALGPKAFIIAGLISVLLALDTREALMPFVVNGLKIADDMKVRPGRVGWAAVAALAVGLAVATPVVLWANYNHGINEDDKWATRDMPKYPFDAGSKEIDKLRDRGELAASTGYSTWQRITNIRPQPNMFWAAGAGLAFVLAFSILRLRFAWWPLHPIMFLVWGTYPIARFSHSFLLGWLIKFLVSKLGGGQKYRSLIPLMLGIIAGDLLGGMFWMVQGAAYYIVSNSTPTTRYLIFPG